MRRAPACRRRSRAPWRESEREAGRRRRESVSAPQLRRGVGPGRGRAAPGRLAAPVASGQGTWRDFANSKQMVDMEIVGAEAEVASARRARRRRKLPSVLKRTATGEIDEAATQEAVLAMFRPWAYAREGRVATPSSAGAKLGEGRSAAWNRAGLSALPRRRHRTGSRRRRRSRCVSGCSRRQGEEVQTPTPTVPLASVRPGLVSHEARTSEGQVSKSIVLRFAHGRLLPDQK